MDDVLSALDAHVGHHVFESVICGTLKSRTRILVTHQVHLASHPAVSRLLFLDAKGHLEFFGRYDELSEDFKSRLRREGEGEGETLERRGGGEVGSDGLGSRHREAQEQRRLGRIQWTDLKAYADACGLGGVSGIAGLMVAARHSSLHFVLSKIQREKAKKDFVSIHFISKKSSEKSVLLFICFSKKSKSFRSTMARSWPRACNWQSGPTPTCRRKTVGTPRLGTRAVVIWSSICYCAS